MKRNKTNRFRTTAQILISPDRCFPLFNEPSGLFVDFAHSPSSNPSLSLSLCSFLRIVTWTVETRNGNSSFPAFFLNFILRSRPYSGIGRCTRIEKRNISILAEYQLTDNAIRGGFKCLSSWDKWISPFFQSHLIIAV